MISFLPKSPAARRTLWVVLTIVLAVGAATGLVLQALKENISFYKTPSELMAMPAGPARYRIGGLVQAGSVQHAADGVTILFSVTDNKTSVPVTYKGIVPDLFREGQGVVAEGMLSAEKVFVADTLLARHDENYMPPEVAKALADKDVHK